VLKPDSQEGGVSSEVSKADLAETLLRDFAVKHGLRLIHIYIDSPDKIISALRSGKGDLAVSKVATTPYLQTFLSETKRIRALGGDGARWLLPKGCGLLEPLNDFIVKFNSTYDPNNFTGDLPDLKKRRYIKVLTRNNPACYFIHRGESMGFEYELAARFAKTQGLQIIVVVPPKWSDLIPWLKAGKGDLIAAAMTVTKKRKAIKGVSFCKTYAPVRQMVVAAKGERGIHKSADLAGRTFTVRKKSSYWETLSNLKNSGVALKLNPAPQTMETDEIIERVADGTYDLTLADDLFVKTSVVRRRISTPMSLGPRRRYAWAVRSSNPLLKKAVDAFIAKEYRGVFHNVLRKKYFGVRSSVMKRKAAKFARSRTRLSPYDGIIKKQAAAQGLPWCLIAAQMFQESRFDPNAKSWAGTVGLMQLMPATAKEMNCRDIRDPRENVKAAVKYLKSLESRLPKSVKGKTRYCFALAGYNGGYGHLVDARKLAAELGLNQNKWFGNVEKAMRLLSRKKYYSKAKYGYCRSSEITSYVQKIIVKYLEYEQAVKGWK
jgi:membrane-bound lytic murein transglycosylase F